MSFCCRAWEQETRSLHSMAGGGGPAERAALDAQIERAADGTWSVNGCCGGGCYVLTEVRFCPFCGADVTR